MSTATLTKLSLAVAGATCLALGTGMAAEAATINFDSLSTGTSVTNQFPGASFSGATVLTQGVDLSPSFPPESLPNVVYNSASTIRVDAVGSLWSQVGGFFTTNTKLNFQAFDISNSLIGFLSLDPNLSSPNQQLALTVPGISYVTMSTVGNNPNTFTLDDFSFTPEAAPIPTPALLPGLLGLGLTALRKRKNEETAEQSTEA